MGYISKLLIIIFVVGAFVGLFKRPASPEELRGGWVTAWTNGFFTPQEADATIAAAKAAKLNALFIQVRKNADAYYNSTIEPRAKNIAADYDPLAYVIEKAHKNGIKVHAWVNVYRVWSTANPPDDPNHIVNLHSDWLNKSYEGGLKATEGLYLDPGVPEAREHIASVITEIASNYNLDGIQLDYIRYPGKEWGYSSIALNKYYSETGMASKPEPGDPKWLDWRRAQVTELVKMISNRVHSAKPKIKLSAATIPWGDCPDDYCQATPYSKVCQDWQQWLTTDLLDANVPMNYRSDSSSKSAKQFRGWLVGFKKWSGGKPVYVGLDVHHNTTSGISKQITAVKNAGLDGFVLFSFNQIPLRDCLVSALSGRSYNTANQAACAVIDAGISSSNEFFDKGIRCATGNQLGMAQVYFKKAIEADPKYAEAYFRLGRCYLREGNRDKAAEYFGKTLDIDPSHAGAKSEIETLINRK